MSNSLSNAVVALGANLNLRGNEPAMTLRNALDAIARQEVVIRSVSRFFATPCFPVGAGPDYVNAAALIATEKSPTELLRVLHAVEHEFGRERIQRWGMRTLDLDLVCFDDLVLPDQAVFDRWLTLPSDAQQNEAPDQLILPHPRLQDRAFVLVPMADIAPDWCHPVLERSVTQMVADLPLAEVEAVTPL
ncbi:MULTISPECIES: 2-amino-4-hydroxy-6-hydroxymethyldihydropteridine diphosphokinase [unclassified Ruegeria]|uniref:2-amino-4-hydroxy-6- hydroxymethyldihydropteridine diphosphokinase n=1 Tax=unclassified Ruegeria TaxID=2625375 RepID=UPI0014895799|nr:MULTISPECIES: 2-amino-4-hydroxy-6-hydroxymethyldihydropteridine diphosphokinase [unclassified Ruegeria]NOD78141.1 2-amino-4-hydroxy-6-hydroxymethyldihydropteridine diphosphokinase [Ruegeria sp. HKCCD4332]NOD90739.1 2-amino-4-hydroxy-6-hydroxymethyldihydropteridine diphosphokinase [Ruegeria sp. HKCCD4318]NOD94969.1 2-amino-4-hydroxy-6-hydroxymethyldihydropteridine diphosphokinase [Ruegeria sp. HKCCD4884]NOE15758.1 2-amino-4-hydroxy-6-hydroxymethyldihydropteridine diphosphokinase [Ruegeria sp.